ncbi:MAG: peptidylprolyl isomerase [Bacteroidota bacterium]|nr:peptidylprolyl isomerase [Bacteroidota bacterium]
MNTTTTKVLISILVLITSYSTYAQNRFTRDETLRKIYTFQYNQNTDSLITYFNDQNPVHREAACLAFASVQDSNAIIPLFNLLVSEKEVLVRKAILYSLGQMNAWQSFNGLQYFSLEKDIETKGLCLETIAKTSKNDLNDFFVNVELFPENAVYMTSYWRALYFANRRKKINVWQETLNQRLNQIDFTKDARTVYIYSQLFKDDLEVGSEKEVQKKYESKNCSFIDAKLKTFYSPYQQLDFLKDSLFSDEALLHLAYSTHHSLIRYFALDVYIKKHWQMIGWNEKINKGFMMYFLRSGDIALISRIAEYVKEQNFAIRPIVIHKEDLLTIQNNLLLPRDFETWIDLEKAVLSFDGKKYQYQSYFSKGYQNPIDWDFIMKVPQNQQVKITTNKGEIIMECKVNEAPASVANFLKLVDSGYYNGKYFHRMVPSFVVQGGCPRGDGWGSLNWNQRSEFSNYLTYQPGSVGLASVGKDSEGVQFFITHTYTQNLDGRYTIFAEVVQGMNIVNQLVVGDVILKVERV